MRVSVTTLLKLLPLALLSLACNHVPDCSAYVDGGETVDGTMCYSRVYREMTISYKAPVATIEQIMLAGDDWSEATGGRTRIDWKVTNDESANVMVSTKDIDKSGYYNPFDDVLWIHVDCDHPREVAIHELGHMFGLGHDPEESAAMFHASVAPITQRDVEHFDRLWNGGVKY